MNALSQLQSLLRDLFQLELADLDFGLYRLLHLKRQEIEAFLTAQLPRRVEETFQSSAGEERATLEKEVSELASRIRKEIAEDALSEGGEPILDHPAFKAKVARDLLDAYEASRRRLQSVQVGEAQKAEVFNHLYAFFSRYYEAGDFIARRRYGARETYAVPYNGEETFFHRDPRLVQDGALKLLQVYLDRFVARQERQAEGRHLEPALLPAAHESVVPYYTVRVSSEELLRELEARLHKPTQLYSDGGKPLPRLHIDRHLFSPILLDPKD